MQQYLLDLFTQHPHWAVVISLVVSTLVAIAGVLPSVFVTGANIFFFGFINGTLISIAGESLGALVSFLLYRYAFRSRMTRHLHRHPRLQQLVNTRGRQAAMLVFSLRLMPLVPSGLITFAAAIGSIGTAWFVAASTVGKIPALLVEALLVKGFLASAWPVQVAMVVVACGLAWMVLSKTRGAKTS
jgi:uncharacterized membrane protein YdjX (TVP38/TMEM64 family)